MPRIPFPKGNHQGGRPKGSLNKATLEAKAFFRGILESPAYQAKLQQRILTGKVSDRILEMAYGYAYGKPKQSHEHSGHLTLEEALSVARGGPADDAE